MVPSQPIDKAKRLLALVKKDISASRTYHVQLTGLNCSEQLKQQALESATRLEGVYTDLSTLILEKKKKMSDYCDVVQEAAAAREEWADRISYCKALVSANGMHKVAKAPKSGGAS